MWIACSACHVGVLLAMASAPGRSLARHTPLPHAVCKKLEKRKTVGHTLCDSFQRAASQRPGRTAGVRRYISLSVATECHALTLSLGLQVLRGGGLSQGRRRGHRALLQRRLHAQHGVRGPGYAARVAGRALRRPLTPAVADKT